MILKHRPVTNAEILICRGLCKHLACLYSTCFCFFPSPLHTHSPTSALRCRFEWSEKLNG